MKVTSILSVILSSLSLNAAHADTLATCSIVSETFEKTVLVEKYPGVLPPDQQHLTTLVDTPKALYVFSETFDGSQSVGIGQTRSGTGFTTWTFAKLPLKYDDLENNVWILCK